MARPAAHLILTTGLAAVQWMRTRRLAPTLAPYVTGFLIDGDHLFDLARYKLTGQRPLARVVLPLHGWEYVPLLWLLDRLFGRALAGGLLLGYLGHLGLDQVTNTTTHPLTYFLTFRWRHGFPSTLFAHSDEREVDWMEGSLLDLWKHF